MKSLNVKDITEAAVASGGVGIARGFLSSLASIFLFFVTRIVPVEWRPFFNWPLYVTFLFGLAVMCYGAVTRETSPS